MFGHIPLHEIDQRIIESINLLLHHCLSNSLLLFFFQRFEWSFAELTQHPLKFCGSTHHLIYVSVCPNNTYLPNFWSQLTQKSPPLFNIGNFPPLKQLIQSLKISLHPLLGFLFDDIELHSNVISVRMAVLLQNQCSQLKPVGRRQL